MTGRPEIACVLDARARIGESAMWHEEEQRLYWADIPAGLIHRFDPATGRNETCDVGQDVGCFAFRRTGGLLAALRYGFHHVDFDAGTVEKLVDPEPELPESRFNDGTPDPAGRMWAGTMARANNAPVGTVYRFDRTRECRAFFDGFFTPNGMAFSPDGRTMYLAESNRDIRTVWAFDYDIDEGVPSNRRVFFDTRAVAGRPDGATVDAEGCYWLAGVGGWQVIRLTPAGKVDRLIPVPVEKPTKVAFGGPRLDTLYVTSIGDPAGLTPGTDQPQAGGLFAFDPGVKGLPAWRFND